MGIELTAEIIANAVKGVLKDKERPSIIAKRLGIHRTTVSRIVRNHIQSIEALQELTADIDLEEEQALPVIRKIAA